MADGVGASVTTYLSACDAHLETSTYEYGFDGRSTMLKASAVA
jgi:hypothetical protein